MSEKLSRSYIEIRNVLVHKFAACKQIKADNQMLWVQKINNITHEANNEIIYKY
ncbi:MAG: hypothetical protein HFJ99_02935 [Eubacterium sp.]|nr:hypothetical protein [Eubacterium sp.]